MAIMPAPLLLSKRSCRCSAILAVSIVILKAIILDKEMIAIDTPCKSAVDQTVPSDAPLSSNQIDVGLLS